MLSIRRNRSRSLGNVLDQDVTQRSSYVNVTGDDSSSLSIEQKIRSSTLTTAAQNKRPKPLPKPSLVDESKNQEVTSTPSNREVPPNKGRHGYEFIDILRVKGNSHPLSISSADIQ